MDQFFKHIDISENDAIIQFGNTFEVDRFIEFDQFQEQPTNRLELERDLINDPDLEVCKTHMILQKLFIMHDYLAITNKHHIPRIKKIKNLRKEYIRPTGHYYWTKRFKYALGNALYELSQSKIYQLKELDLYGDYYNSYSVPASDNSYWLSMLKYLPQDIRVNLVDFDFNSLDLNVIQTINSKERLSNPLIIYDLTHNLKKEEQRKIMQNQHDEEGLIYD